MPLDRLRPTTGADLTPLLFWNDNTPCAGGAALACPQCAGANLHLDTIHFAVPTDDHYTPTVGVSISPHNGTVTADEDARELHAGTNRGPMVAVGYWCENGCCGRIELREHKGYLFTSLHNKDAVEPLC